MKLECGDRVILVTGKNQVNFVSDFLNNRQHALLLPAYTLVEKELSFSLATSLAALNCVEICSLGPLASELEDDLDFMLERDGSIDIATTSFHNSQEALEYFLFAAGGASSSLCLVAAVEGHADLTETIVSLAASA